MANTDPVRAPGGTTSEFKMVLLFIGVLVMHAILRAVWDQGLELEELGMAAAATGVYWYGRNDLKKTILNSDDKDREHVDELAKRVASIISNERKKEE